MNGLDSLNKCFLNKFVFSVLVAMILISCPATKSFAGGFDETFQKDIQKYIQEEPILKGALTGISIRSARNGEVLFEYNGDTKMMKITYEGKVWEADITKWKNADVDAY